jgi:hypothetical protein
MKSQQGNNDQATTATHYAPWNPEVRRGAVCGAYLLSAGDSVRAAESFSAARLSLQSVPFKRWPAHFISESLPAHSHYLIFNFSMAVSTIDPNFKAEPSCLATNNIWKIFADCPLKDVVCWYFLQGPPITSSCVPKDYNPTPTAYYSPASCPTGYTSACDETRTVGTVTETAYTCCPTCVVTNEITTCNRISY